MENVDKGVVLTAVERIESMNDDDIRQLVNNAMPPDVPPAADRDRVANGLIKRRGSIRGAMKSRGWLP